MFYSLHVVEPLRYDSVLIKETNDEWWWCGPISGRFDELEGFWSKPSI